MFPYMRTEETPFGGLIGYPWVGPPWVVVLRRDFGLTNEAPCSEEAHTQMLKWWKERNAWAYAEARVPVLLDFIRSYFVALPSGVPVTVGVLTALEVALGELVDALALQPVPPVP